MKILIIDDNIDYSNCIKYALKKYNFDVQLLNENFENFENIVVNLKPNLILVDIELGSDNIDGKKISLKLKTNPKTANIPTIALTCLNSKQDIHNIMKDSGCNAYIAKDSDLEDLINLIKIYTTK